MPSACHDPHLLKWEYQEGISCTAWIQAAFVPAVESSLKDLMCMDRGSLLSSLSVPPAQDVTLLVIRLIGVGLGVQSSHSTPKFCSFFWFYTEFGFLFGLPPFYCCQGHPVCFHPLFRGCYFSNLCSVWGVRTQHVYHLKLSLQLFGFCPFLPVSAAAQFSKTVITQLLSCLCVLL